MEMNLVCLKMFSVSLCSAPRGSKLSFKVLKPSELYRVRRNHVKGIVHRKKEENSFK